MKNKLLKSMTMIIAVAMLVSMVPVMASGTLDGFTVVPNEDYTKITVTPDANSGVTEYTLLAVRADSELTMLGATDSLEALTDEQLQNQIEYIDQPLVTAGAVEFTLRDRGTNAPLEVQNVTGRTITVFLGAANASAIPKTVVIPCKAPTVELDDEVYIADVTEDASFITVTDREGWLNEASLAVYTMVDTVETEVGSIEDGAISFIDGYPTNEEATYTIKGKDVPSEGYKAFTPVTFSAISKLGAIKAELPETLTIDKAAENKTKWIFTIPTDFVSAVDAAVSVTWTVKEGDADAVAAEATVIITRPDDDNDANNVVEKAVKITATITDGSNTLTKDYDYEVPEVGVDGYTVVAADVNIVAPAGGAYKREHAKLITIKLPAEDAINITNQVVKIGDNQLYYTPERTKDYTGQNEGTKYTFVGLIIDESNAYATADAVAAATTIENGTLTKLYYGLPVNTTASRGVIIQDLITFVGAYNAEGNGEDSELDANKLISMDVFGIGCTEIQAGIKLVGAYNSTDGLTKDFAIFNK